MTKGKRQGKALYRNTMRSQAHDTAQACGTERPGGGAQTEAHGALGQNWARGQWAQARHVAQGSARARCDMAGPGHDTAGPRPATRPLGRHDTAPVRVPRRACARKLDQVGALCTWLSSDPVFEPVFDSVMFLSH